MEFLFPPDEYLLGDLVILYVWVICIVESIKMVFGNFDWQRRSGLFWKRHRSLAKLLILLWALPLLAQNETAPQMSVDSLLSAPDTVNFEQRSLFLHADLWRQYDEVQPSDSLPLNGTIYIQPADTLMERPDIIPDAVWVIKGDSIWSGWLDRREGEGNPEYASSSQSYFENGPYWGPRIFVDIVVRFRDSEGHSYLLRADHQWVAWRE